MQRNLRFSIDRGGTFTDVFAEVTFCCNACCSMVFEATVRNNFSTCCRFQMGMEALTRGGTCPRNLLLSTSSWSLNLFSAVSRVLKLLSEDPSNYRDAPQEGIRRLLEEITGIAHPRSHPVDTSRILSIRMGTTVSVWQGLHSVESSNFCLFDLQAETSILHAGCRWQQMPYSSARVSVVRW